MNDLEKSQLPLMVQGDRTVLLDVHSPLANVCRDCLILFAQLLTSPEHIHTYKITPLSLWNAESVGYTASNVIDTLAKYSRYDLPQNVIEWVKETDLRFGKLRLVDCVKKSMQYIYLVCADKLLYQQILQTKPLMKILETCTSPLTKEDTGIDISETEGRYAFCLKMVDRGEVKCRLLEVGYPVKDCVPMLEGKPLEIKIRDTCFISNKPFVFRDYQEEAARAVVGNNSLGTGYGVVVLPCGAGKTVVGINIMQKLQTNTLIITTNVSAVHQWMTELIDKTYLTKDDIAQYTGEEKDIAAVTVTTYQILTWRPNKESDYPHFEIFSKRAWGLIIYDEVHTLPAPVFQVASQIQAVRRVGLTATLIREDGKEGYVFSLVGPKRYDVPWKQMEMQGWIAKAQCIEVRVDLPEDLLNTYATSTIRQKYKIASENPTKIQVACDLALQNAGEKILIIGQYIKQLELIANKLDCPIITGSTKNSIRDKIYNDFRQGKISTLVLSKVANFAIDLPDASLAIQVSGTFGSRQEEAQRLGRIMRPKERIARFFTLVTRNTSEEDFASSRQKFLCSQGYEYKIVVLKSHEDGSPITVTSLSEVC